MTGTLVKCPQCTYQGPTLRGIKIHRRKMHKWIPSNQRPIERPKPLPLEFVESLRPDQLNLLGKAYTTQQNKPLRTRQSPDSGRDRESSTIADRSPSAKKSAFASPGLNSMESSPPQTQRNDEASNNGNILNSTERASSSNKRDGNSAYSTSLRPRTPSNPTSTSLSGEAGGDPDTMSRMGVSDYFARQNSANDGQLNDPPAVLYSGSEGRPEHGQNNHDTKQNPGSPHGSTEGRNAQSDTFIEYDMPGFQSIERSMSRAPSRAFNVDVTRSSQNERPRSLEYPDEMGAMDTSFAYYPARNLMSRSRSAGRNALKNLWPACFFDLLTVQPHEEGAFPRQENELRACRDLVTLLGDCSVLDYNASSAWDLVLRCSLCEMPMSGIRNMEAHIKKHLQQTPYPCEIRC